MIFVLEKKLEYLRQSKPRMNSSKRSFLGLSVDEITDLSKLQDEASIHIIMSPFKSLFFSLTAPKSETGIARNLGNN